MDGFGLFNKSFGGGLFYPCAFRATIFGKVAARGLLERAVIGANDRGIGLGVYILNF